MSGPTTPSEPKTCETCGQPFIPPPELPAEPECPRCLAEWASG
jgi:predicted Zn-ribbon and HTH transcriptional regulator